MVTVSLVGAAQQLAVEAIALHTGLVAGDEEHGAAGRIESEGHAPDTAIGLKAQLLHVRVGRAVEGVDGGAAECRAVFGQTLGARDQLDPDRRVQLVQLGLEPGLEKDCPAHAR